MGHEDWDGWDPEWDWLDPGVNPDLEQEDYDEERREPVKLSLLTEFIIFAIIALIIWLMMR